MQQGQEALEEEKRVGLLLGWFLFQPPKSQLGRVLSNGKNHSVVELKNKERLYCISLPELSLQEAELAAGAFEEYKSTANPEIEELSALDVFFLDYCGKNSFVLDSEQQAYLLELLRLMVYGFGPLSKLLENESLEEIAIIGLGKEKPVMVFDKGLGSWIRTNLYYASEASVKNLVNKMSRKLGKRLSMQTPRLNAMLPDGSRLSCSISPVSFLGPNVTIRKFGKKPFTPSELVANNTASKEAMGFLQLAFECDCSVLIAGNTGSGKTSLLNALFRFVPGNERVIVVEETPELNFSHLEHLVKLNVSEGLNVGMNELIVDSLRMRPDRVVVGEVRNAEEVRAFIDTLLAGQGKGSYCTFHAQSSRDALTRMKKLGVLEIDLLALDLIVMQKRWTTIQKGERAEKRRIVEICEVLERDGRPVLNALFEFEYAKDCLKKVGESKRIREKFEKSLNSGNPESFGKAVAEKAGEIGKNAGKAKRLME